MRVGHAHEVASRDGVDRGDGEPPLGAVGERERREHLLDEAHRLVRRDAIQTRERLNLLADGRRARVLGRVNPCRRDLLVRVLLTHRQSGECQAHRIPDDLAELVTVGDDELRLVDVECHRVDDLARPGHGEFRDPISLSGRDPCGHRPPPCMFFSESLGTHD